MAEQNLISKEFINESSTVFRNTKEIKAVLDKIKREVAKANYVTPANNGTSDSKDKIAHKIASIKVYDKDNNEVKWSKEYNEANTLKAQEEVTYIVKLTGDKDIKDEKVFNGNLKKVKFYFWVQDENGKRIEITTPTKTHGIQKRTGLLTSDRTTDIFELRNGETLNANLQQSAYFYATRVTYDLEKKEARITVKWSKWMDRYMARMEATQHFAKGDGGNTTCSRYIQAQPEILKGYWTNEKKENIDNKTVGYKDTVYLYLKTLGMGGKTVTTQLWEEGITFMGGTSSNDEKLCMNENILWELEGRHNYKKLVIPDQSTEEYKEQRKAVWEKDPLDIYFTIPSEKDTKGYKHKFGDLLKLSSKEQIVEAYFAKAVKQKAIKDGTVADEKDKDTKKAEQQTVYERIDSASLGSELYLVAETTNMHGRNLTLKVFDNEELMAKDTKTSINILDKDGNQQYQLQNVKVDAQTGKAIAKIKLRPKSDEDYKKLKEKFKDDKKAKLFIGISYIDSGHIPRYKKFLDDGEFEVKTGLDITTFFIHHDGKIEKHIASSPKKENKSKYKYVYLDKNNNEHEICIVDFHTTKKKKNGVVYKTKPTHSKEVFDKNVTEGNTSRRVKYTNNDIAEYGKHPTKGKIWRLYEALKEDIEIVKMPDSLNYSKDSVVIKYVFSNTKRRYTGPGPLAGFIGALADYGKEIKTTGSCFKEGSCFPSSEHVNGVSVDTIYKWVKTEDQKIIDAMKKFHFTERLVGNKKYFKGFKNSSDGGSLHNSHLHSGLFDDSKIKVVK